MNQPYKRHKVLVGIFEHLRDTVALLSNATKVDANGVRGILIPRNTAEKLRLDTLAASNAVQALLEHFSAWDSGITAGDLVNKEAVVADVLDALAEEDTNDTDSSGGDRRGNRRHRRA